MYLSLHLPEPTFFHLALVLLLLLFALGVLAALLLASATLAELTKISVL